MFQILTVESQSRINYLKNMRTQTIVVLVFLAMFILLVAPGIVISAFLALLGVDISFMSSIVMLISVTLIIFLSLMTVNKIVKDLFMNRNMTLYMTFPVSVKQLFLAKVIMQLLTNILPFTLVIGVFLGSALSVREGNILPFFSTMSYMLLLSLVIIGISYIIVFFVTKVSKAARVSEILMLVGGFVGVLPYLIITLGASHYEAVLNLMPDMSFWFEGYLYQVDFPKMALNFTAAVIMSFIVLYGVTKFSGQGFTKGWLGEKARSGKTKASEAAVSTPVRSLLLKDLILTGRDFKEWSAILSQYFLPFIIYFVGIYQMGSGVYVETGAALMAISITGTVIISLFTASLNTARDANHYDMLKVLPIQPKDITMAKFLYNIITIIPVYLIMASAAFIITEFSWAHLLFSYLCIIFTALAVIPIGMLIGISSPVVNKKKPTDRIGIAANIMLTIALVVFMFSTSLLTIFYVDDSGSLIYSRVLIMILILVVASGVSVFIFLKRVARVYDKGLIIEYKG